MTKPKMRVVDVPITATAEEAQLLLNAPLEDGYYSYKMTFVQLPNGIGARAFFTLRVKPERDDRA